MSFLEQEDHHSLLFVKVIPNSSTTKINQKFIDEKNQEWLKINISAPPEDGKANDELIKFLAKFLKIPKSEIIIIRGETSRLKVLQIAKHIDITLLHQLSS